MNVMNVMVWISILQPSLQKKQVYITKICPHNFPLPCFYTDTGTCSKLFLTLSRAEVSAVLSTTSFISIHRKLHERNPVNISRKAAASILNFLGTRDYMREFMNALVKWGVSKLSDGREPVNEMLRAAP